MTATAHAIVGAALATVIRDPIVLSVSCLSSHFIMDCIPHWDFGVNWRSRPKLLTGVFAIADTFIGITLAYLLFWGKTSAGLIAIGILFAELPDWMEAPWFILKKDSFIKRVAYRIYKFQSRFHVKAQLPLGGITQILVILLAIYAGSV